VSATRHRIQFPSFVWIGSITAFVRTGGGERPRHRHKHPFPLTAAGAPARISILEPATCCLAALLTGGFLPSARAETVIPAIVVSASSSRHAASYASFVAEASRRFAIPQQWIRAVMQVESKSNACTISPQGALGLMQIMPGTWVELCVRYDLGIDPLDPHDNILAGTAHLREMLDRFGTEGFLAAYNAGPRRYQDHLATGRPLPGQTEVYAATLASLIRIEQRDLGRFAGKRTILWQRGSVFVEPSSGVSDSSQSALAKDVTRRRLFLHCSRMPPFLRPSRMSSTQRRYVKNAQQLGNKAAT
jgi:Transglycosylase SLT domain